MVEQAAPWLWGVLAIGAGLVALRAWRRGGAPTGTGGPAPLAAAIALGALFAAVAAALDRSLLAPLAWFVGVTVALLALFARWRALQADDRLPPGVGGNRLVGMAGRVLAAAPPATPGTHRAPTATVLVGEETWQAVAVDDVALAPDDVVTVVGVRGTTVVVAPTTPAGPDPTGSTSRPAGGAT